MTQTQLNDRMLLQDIHSTETFDKGSEAPVRVLERETGRAERLPGRLGQDPDHQGPARLGGDTTGDFLKPEDETRTTPCREGQLCVDQTPTTGSPIG